MHFYGTSINNYENVSVIYTKHLLHRLSGVKGKKKSNGGVCIYIYILFVSVDETDVEAETSVTYYHENR